MKVLLFANTDWYIYRFRLPLAEMLLDAGHELVLVSPPGKYAGLLVGKGFRHVAFSFSRREVNPAAELTTIGRLHALCRRVPRELINRPKMGFGVPLHDWLRGPLRGWAEDLSDEDRLRRGRYFHSVPIR